jgi:hypothetical protein
MEYTTDCVARGYHPVRIHLLQNGLRIENRMSDALKRGGKKENKCKESYKK